MIAIEARVPGRREALVPRWEVPPPPEVERGDGLTLRELIGLTVRQELAAYAERRAEGRFTRVLTERQLDAGLASGRVDSGGRAVPAAPMPEVAVATALEAFVDGLYLVLVDGTQHEDLDAQIMLGVDSTVTYVRLVALAGG